MSPERNAPRVLHVVATLERGGTETSCVSLAREFGRRRIENHVAVLRPGDRQAEEALEEIAGAPMVLPTRRLQMLVAFHRLCRRLKPDAVAIHFFMLDHVVLALAARLAGVSRVLAVQGNPGPVAGADPHARKVAMLIRLSRLSGTRIISASRWIERSLRALAPLPASARVIHNGCDVDGISRAARSARDDRTDRRHAVILMVARLDPIKDHATLLDAVGQMPESIDGRPVRLVLAGDGPLRAALEKRAEDLRIASRVVFLGARKDVPDLLGGADVFCLSTTRDEGFGVVLVEALAAGVPVVASDAPACREVLERGRLGALVEPGDAEALARALETALRTPQGMPSTEDVARRYGVEAMADGYLDALFGESVAPAASHPARRRPA